MFTILVSLFHLIDCSTSEIKTDQGKKSLSNTREPSKSAEAGRPSEKPRESMVSNKIGSSEMTHLTRSDAAHPDHPRGSQLTSTPPNSGAILLKLAQKRMGLRDSPSFNGAQADRLWVLPSEMGYLA